MATISGDSTLLEVAAIVSAALEEAGLKSVLSGGAAISIYTDNRYESVDLDFVSSVAMHRLLFLKISHADLRYNCGTPPNLRPSRQTNLTCCFRMIFPNCSADRLIQQISKLLIFRALKIRVSAPCDGRFDSAPGHHKRQPPTATR
jgi:hypothetical protein